MAYGQTGSGKTHTMLGNPESDQPYYGEDSSPVTEAREGIVPQSAREIFRHECPVRHFNLSFVYPPL